MWLTSWQRISDHCDTFFSKQAHQLLQETCLPRPKSGKLHVVLLVSSVLFAILLNIAQKKNQKMLHAVLHHK